MIDDTSCLSRNSCSVNTTLFPVLFPCISFTWCSCISFLIFACDSWETNDEICAVFNKGSGILNKWTSCFSWIKRWFACSDKLGDNLKLSFKVTIASMVHDDWSNCLNPTCDHICTLGIFNAILSLNALGVCERELILKSVIAHTLFKWVSDKRKACWFGILLSIENWYRFSIINSLSILSITIRSLFALSI